MWIKTLPLFWYPRFLIRSKISNVFSKSLWLFVIAANRMEFNLFRHGVDGILTMDFWQVTHGTPMGWVCVITCDQTSDTNIYYQIYTHNLTYYWNTWSQCSYCLHIHCSQIVLCIHAGLTCGLFTRKSEEVPCPDIGTGLYVRTRDNQVVKVTFFQCRIRLEIDDMQI